MGTSRRQKSVIGIATASLMYIGRALAEAVFPRKCRACGQYWSLAPGPSSTSAETSSLGRPENVLADLFQQVARPFLCPACITDFKPVASPLCSCCGTMFPSRTGDDHLCGNCMQHPFQFRRARSAGVYGGALLALIHQLKYRACFALCQPLGALLQQTFACHWQPHEIDLVLPVPLHRSRLRQRGFNQAQMLARAWRRAKSANPIGCHMVNPRDVMIRSRPTMPQTGLGKMARRRNIRGAFEVIDTDRVTERRILLVDDVYTTGATADEAARTLRRHGAVSVDLITVARTMPRSSV